MAPILLPPPVRHFMNSIQRTGPPLGYEGHQCKGGCEPPSSAWSLTKLPAIARAASSADRCTATARSWTPRTRSPTAPNRAAPPPASQRREYSQCCGRDRSVGYGGAREDEPCGYTVRPQRVSQHSAGGAVRGGDKATSTSAPRSDILCSTESRPSAGVWLHTANRSLNRITCAQPSTHVVQRSAVAVRPALWTPSRPQRCGPVRARKYFGLVRARACDGTAACFAATVPCARKCGGSVHSSLHLHD
jgi:hypothetical protein